MAANTETRYTASQMNHFGFYLFLLSESMLFLGLVASRFYLAGTETPDSVSVPIAVALTALLLTSSVSAYRAELAARRGDYSAVVRSFAITILLGSIFIAGVGYEWSAGFEHFAPGTLYGTIFFAMTGIHAFHLVTGIVFIAIVMLNTSRGRLGGDIWPVEAAVRYWHFVDAAWFLLFFPTLYLL